MINKTFGAPLGGTTRAGQYGVDCAVLRSLLRSNVFGAGGSWVPSIAVMALGEPGTPVICCASAECNDHSALSATTTRIIHQFGRIGCLQSSRCLVQFQYRQRQEERGAVALTLAAAGQAALRSQIFFIAGRRCAHLLPTCPPKFEIMRPK